MRTPGPVAAKRPSRPKQAATPTASTVLSPEIPVTEVSLRETHRLIPSRYSAAGTVLSRLAAEAGTLDQLMELDDATNDRFLGEEGLLSGIGIHELVYGVRYAHIVNAAFTHASPEGGRFNTSTRGAWYAATERATAVAEVAYHRTRQLEEVNWAPAETVTVDDYVADLTSPLHDLRSDREPSPYLRYLEAEPIPACYQASQALAGQLLQTPSDGLIYPSVRRAGGTCIACFRPALVYNVRRGARLEMALTAGRPFQAFAGAGDCHCGWIATWRGHSWRGNDAPV